MISLSTGSFPTPLVPSPTTIGNGSMGRFSTAMGATGTSQKLNQALAALQLALSVGAGGYAIVSGLGLTTPSGLNVQLGIGVANLDTPIEVVAATPYGPNQVLQPAPYTLPASSTCYLWLTDSGALAYATTLAPPTGGKLFIGTVVTSSSAVTSIDTGGVVYVADGERYRQSNDVGAPTDTLPAGARVATITQGGKWFWDGVSHKMLVDLTKQLPTPSVKRTIAGNIQLLPTDANIQQFDPGSGSYTINMPDPSKITPGHTFNIQHVGTAGTITVKSFSGSTTIVSSMTNGQTVAVTAIGPVGGAGWPTSATPVAMPAMAT